MSERVFRGVSAAAGIAMGNAVVMRDLELADTRAGSPAEQERALGVLARIADDLGSWAALARQEARVDEAEILEANRLIAEDPALRDSVCALALESAAERAVVEASAEHARALEELDDPHLAARGADVRALGRRAARVLAGHGIVARRSEPAVVVARDLGPADLAELRLGGPQVLGFALAEGAATSHAAIIARSFGLPFVVGLGGELLSIADDTPVLLDGDSGTLVLSPTTATRRRAERVATCHETERRRMHGARHLPPVTTDGRRIKLLCNAASSRDVASGLESGAEGVGLLRTELAFLDSESWPSEAAHSAAMRPLLQLLEGAITTVRTLDFGGDKTPPFLAGTPERGLSLSLTHPEALSDQLRAILEVGRLTQLRVLFPLVHDVDELLAAKRLVFDALEAVSWTGRPPQLGAMIETPDAAAAADVIAGHVDFVSIGTNDMVHYALGLDRKAAVASAVAAIEPGVLSLIARIVEAAHRLGIPVDVCGEAAGEPLAVGLLVGLGVDELSVSPQQLDLVRWTVRGLSATDAADAARAALNAGSAREALDRAEALLRSAKLGD